jgi:hypothetical protein
MALITQAAVAAETGTHLEALAVMAAAARAVATTQMRLAERQTVAVAAELLVT